MSCDGCDEVTITLDRAAKNVRGFKLQTKDEDGVVSDRNIDWAVTAKFTVFNVETEDELLLVDDQDQFDIDAPNSEVEVTILSAQMTDLVRVDWENAWYRLDLIGADEEPVAVSWGPVKLRPYSQ